MRDAEGERRLDDKPGEVAVTANDRIIVETPGAGGYGSPKSRDKSQIERDRHSGKYTDGFIRKYYGGEWAGESK